MTQPPPNIADIDMLRTSGKTEAQIMASLRAGLDAGAEVNAIGRNGETALHKVCRRGFLEAATLLLDAGADIECKGINDRTPFMEAAGSLNVALMKHLLDRGADPRALDTYGKDALHQYLRCNEYAPTQEPDFPAADVEGMKLLADSLGRAPDFLEECQIYSFRKHLASFSPDVALAVAWDMVVKDHDIAKIAQWLDDGGPLDPGRKYGASPIATQAGRENNVPLLDFLLRRGVDINSKTGCTPLQAAAIHGAKEAFQRLVSVGADTTVRYTWNQPHDTDIMGLAQKCPDKTMPEFVARAIANDSSVHYDIQVKKPLRLRPPSV